MSTNSNSTPRNPHFVLVPLMAQGHMIPMVDMAQLLSTRGATTTLVTTPLNMSRLSSIVNRIKNSNLPINFLSLRFPCAEVGLPEGCENIDEVPSSNLLKNFMHGCALLKEPLIMHLKQQEHAPNCIIFDCGHIWMDSVARELGIPRITFNGYGCFALLCRHIFHSEGFFEKIEDENEVFVMPGMPHRVEMTKSRSPSNFGGPDMDDYKKQMMKVEMTSDATIVNSFEDLEAPYVRYLEKAMKMKVWTVGPMSLYNTQIPDMAFRGNKSSMNELQITKWLDSKKENSVLYVSFGSLARTPPSQLFEIGLGLEASDHPFVWVIKPGTKSSEIEGWLIGKGFEGRVRERGLIIRGWAPQLVVLTHPSVGGFMTHCGWNSSLESVSAGVPMITWPQFGEQFLNEKVIVEVHGVGVAIGVDGPVKWGFEHEEVMVKRERVEESVRGLMNDGDDVRGMRERVKELGEKAKRAMEKNGSSYENMKLLIQQIRDGMRDE